MRASTRASAARTSAGSRCVRRASASSATRREHGTSRAGSRRRRPRRPRPRRRRSRGGWRSPSSRSSAAGSPSSIGPRPRRSRSMSSTSPRSCAATRSRARRRRRFASPRGSRFRPGRAARQRAAASSASIDARGELGAFAAGVPARAQAKLVAKDLPLHLLRHYLDPLVDIEVQKAQTSFRGDVRWSSSHAGASVSVAGDATIDEFRATNSATDRGAQRSLAMVRDAGSGRQLVNWKSMTLRGIALHDRAGRGNAPERRRDDGERLLRARRARRERPPQPAGCRTLDARRRRTGADRQLRADRARRRSPPLQRPLRQAQLQRQHQRADRASRRLLLRARGTGPAARARRPFAARRRRANGVARDRGQGQPAREPARARPARQGARSRAAAAVAVCDQVRGLRHRARQDERRPRLRRPAERRAVGDQQDRPQPARLRRQGTRSRRRACRSSSPSRCSPTVTA